MIQQKQGGFIGLHHLMQQSLYAYIFKQTVCRCYQDSQEYSAELVPIEQVAPCDKPRWCGEWIW